MQFASRIQGWTRLAALGAVLAGCTRPGLSQNNDAVLALTNVTVIDGTGSAPRPGSTVIIRNRRIADIYPSNARTAPAGARVIDLSGQYLIPGLIDGHVHLGTQRRDPDMMLGILRSVFLGGVTSARDMGGSLATVRPLAVRSRSDTVASPRIAYSAILAGPGRWFTGEFGTQAADGLPMGTSPAVRRIDDASDVARVIHDAKVTGATGIKIYNAVSTPLLRALVAEAHRQGLRAWSHLSIEPARPSDAIGAGMDVVSHGDQFRGELVSVLPIDLPDSLRRATRLREFSTFTPDDERLTPLLAQMKPAGTMLDPTLFIMLPSGATADTMSTTAWLRGPFHFAATMTGRANRMGIPIVAGTDAIGGSSANLHAELQLLVDSAGLSPMQALQAATLNAARAIGVQDSIGTVAPGKLADLVVLRADPSRDIRNTQTVVMVIKGGVVYPRTTPMRSGPHARPAP